jgi:threonine dehydrogenase-like Zn-dependent dehydrogenase
MYGFEPFGGDWGGFLADVVRVPYADAMLIGLPVGIDPVVVASMSDNIPDAWRTVGPYVGGFDVASAAVLIVGGAGPTGCSSRIFIYITSVIVNSVPCGQAQTRRPACQMWAC